MPSSRTLVPSAFIALAALLAAHGSAEACSAPQCALGGAYLPAGGVVPASLPHILFRPGLGDGDMPTDATVSLFRVQGGSQTPVDITTEVSGPYVLISPVSPLAPDSDYALEGSDLCLDSLTSSSFHTGAAAAQPTTLGTLTASAMKVDTLDVSTISGSCNASITAAQVDLDIAFSTDADLWRSALSYTTTVDGQPWNYAPSLIAGSTLGGSPRTTLFASCKSDDGGADTGLKEGMHSVTMEAALPGTSLVLKTPPISVNLTCSTGGTGGGGGGGAGGTGTDTDTGIATIGTGEGGSGAGSSGGGSSSCSVGGGAADGAWMIPALAALAALGRRRKPSRAR